MWSSLIGVWFLCWLALSSAQDSQHYFTSNDGTVFNNSEGFSGFTFHSGGSEEDSECRELIYSEPGVVILGASTVPTNAVVQPYIPANSSAVFAAVDADPTSRSRLVLCVVAGSTQTAQTQTINVRLSSQNPLSVAPTSWLFTFTVRYTVVSDLDLPVAFSFGTAETQPPVVYPGGAVVPPITISLVTEAGGPAVLAGNAVVSVYAWPIIGLSDSYDGDMPNATSPPEPLARVELRVGIATASLARIVSSHLAVGVYTHLVFTVTSASLPPSSSATASVLCPMGGSTSAFGVQTAALRVAMPPCGGGTWRAPGSALTECSSCPDGTICDGGSYPACSKGYWRAVPFIPTMPLPLSIYHGVVCVPSSVEPLVSLIPPVSALDGARAPAPTDGAPLVSRLSWTGERASVVLGALVDRCTRVDRLASVCAIYSVDIDMVSALIGVPSVTAPERPMSYDRWLGADQLRPRVLTDIAGSKPYNTQLKAAVDIMPHLVAAVEAFSAAQARGMTASETIYSSLVLSQDFLTISVDAVEDSADASRRSSNSSGRAYERVYDGSMGTRRTLRLDSASTSPTIGERLAECSVCADNDNAASSDLDPKCLGGIAARCSDGYTGYICRSCVDGYGRDKADCQQCPSVSFAWLSVLAFVVVIIAMFILVILSVAFDNSQFGLLGAEDRHVSVGVKLFTNHLQLIADVLSFGLAFPPSIRWIGSLGVSLATGNLNLRTVNCLFNLPPWGPLMIALVFPIAVFICTGVFFGFFMFCRRLRGLPFNTWESWVSTNVIIFYLVWPNVVLQSLQTVRCRGYGDSVRFLSSYTDWDCSSDAHAIVVVIAVLGCIFYGLFAPSLSMGATTRHFFRHTLLSRPGATAYSFIHRGFRLEMKWYEYIIFFRKWLLILLSFFVTSSAAQGTLAMFVVAMHISLNLLLRPWDRFVYSALDMTSLFTCFLTITIGLLLGEDAVTSVGLKGVLVVVCFAANIIALLCLLAFPILRVWKVLSYVLDKKVTAISTVAPEKKLRLLRLLQRAFPPPNVPRLYPRGSEDTMSIAPSDRSDEAGPVRVTAAPSRPLPAAADRDRGDGWAAEHAAILLDNLADPEMLRQLQMMQSPDEEVEDDDDVDNTDRPKRPPAAIMAALGHGDDSASDSSGRGMIGRNGSGLIAAESLRSSAVPPSERFSVAFDPADLTMPPIHASQLPRTLSQAGGDTKRGKAPTHTAATVSNTINSNGTTSFGEGGDDDQLESRIAALLMEGLANPAPAPSLFGNNNNNNNQISSVPLGAGGRTQPGHAPPLDHHAPLSPSSGAPGKKIKRTIRGVDAAAEADAAAAAIVKPPLPDSGGVLVGSTRPALSHLPPTSRLPPSAAVRIADGEV